MQMWERTEGVPRERLRDLARADHRGRDRVELKLGADTKSALCSAVQPESRGAAWRSCGVEQLAKIVRQRP